MTIIEKYTNNLTQQKKQQLSEEQLKCIQRSDIAHSKNHSFNGIQQSAQKVTTYTYDKQDLSCKKKKQIQNKLENLRTNRINSLVLKEYKYQQKFGLDQNKENKAIQNIQIPTSKGKVDENTKQIQEIQHDLKNYNMIMNQAERYFKDQAVAEAYNENWITDSDSDASVGKADQLMKEKQRRKDENPFGEESDNDGCNSEDDDTGSGNSQGNSQEDDEQESQGFGSIDNDIDNDCFINNSRRKSSDDNIIENAAKNEGKQITDGFAEIIFAGRGCAFEMLLDGQYINQQTC